MSSIQEKEIYSLVALFTHSLNLEVTAENMEKVFKKYNIPFSKKLATLYEMTPAEYNNLIRAGSSVQVAAVATEQPSETKKTETKEEAKPAAAEEDEDLEFGDLFG